MYAATSSIVAFGAVVGRLNVMQAVFMAFWTSAMYCLNFWIAEVCSSVLVCLRVKLMLWLLCL